MAGNRRYRRFGRSPRTKRPLGWVGTLLANPVPFDVPTVSNINLVSGNDFIGALGDHVGINYTNIKRIVGDFVARPSNGQLTGTVDNFAGAYFWAIVIQDDTDTDVIDPSSSGDMSHEKVLAHGMGMMSGVGGDAALNWNAVPTHIDVKSNRRLLESENLNFIITGEDIDGMGTEDDFAVHMSLRTLITADIRSG